MTNESIPTPAAVKLELITEIKLATAVLGAGWSLDGERIYAACLDGGVYEVLSASGHAQQIGRHASFASGICHLPQAQLLISGGYDGVLQWHDTKERQTLRTVHAHRFWSWKLAASKNERWVASATGQYRAGGYKYEPAPEEEPSVKVFDTKSGELEHQFTHVPPVLSVAFSPDGAHLAAGNMMGEVRVWELQHGQRVAQWTTPDFTSWGEVKSHHYIGGIFDLQFTPDGDSVLVCGMGPMTDPMAGNGKQTWQRFAWRETPARKLAEITETDRGNGLMETLALHPNGRTFLMAGKLAQGKWNTALFDLGSGKLTHSLDTKMRVTQARFTADGARLMLAGAVGQERKKDGRYPEFGRLKIFQSTI